EQVARRGVVQLEPGSIEIDGNVAVVAREVAERRDRGGGSGEAMAPGAVQVENLHAPVVAYEEAIARGGEHHVRIVGGPIRREEREARALRAVEDLQAA